MRLFDGMIESIVNDGGPIVDEFQTTPDSVQAPLKISTNVKLVWQTTNVSACEQRIGAF